MRISLIILALWLALPTYAQNLTEKIEELEMRIDQHGREADLLRSEADSLKLIDLSERLRTMGWPGSEGEIVEHSAMALSYSEEHELARWVTHIILPDVAEGRTSRTNDFRPDPKVSTGSAEEADYFLKKTDENGKIEYDGYGYDRGHLAPSADFRWNQKALSESYFYSNMTPQAPSFNREAWAELEGYIRGYVIENQNPVFVVTGPILTGDLQKVERSVNGVTLPNFHFKVVIDTTAKRGIGFLMPNEKCEKPIEAYAVSIDEIENLTRLNFFPNLKDEMEGILESTKDYNPWLPAEQRGDARIIPSQELAKGQYNTLQAYQFIDSNKNIEVCGTVVSTFKSNKNNVFINLDKAFPNTVFTLTIWSRNLPNFSYSPDKELQNLKVCARGKVTRREGVMQMDIESEKQVTIFQNEF